MMTVNGHVASHGHGHGSPLTDSHTTSSFRSNGHKGDGQHPFIDPASSTRQVNDNKMNGSSSTGTTSSTSSSINNSNNYTTTTSPSAASTTTSTTNGHPTNGYISHRRAKSIVPCLPAISSMSLGRAWIHRMSEKLDGAQKHQFKGLELFFEDLQYFSDAEHASQSPESLKKAAKTVRAMCDERGIRIFALQPFNQYEGLIDRSEHARRIDEAKLWIKLAQILGADFIGVPSSFLPADKCTGDLETIVNDLTELADLGLQETPPMKFAFESLSWGTHIDTWEQSYDVVMRVDRPNFGLCLDTFNIAARVYAAPDLPGGKTKNAELEMDASIKRLKMLVEPRKLFYVQVVDAERLEQPLVKGHPFYAADQPPRMSWSRNCRLFYGEEDRGAYLPVKEISRAIFEDLGYTGWVSMELFSRTLVNKDASVPESHAERAAVAWEKLKDDFDLS